MIKVFVVLTSLIWTVLTIATPVQTFGAEKKVNSNQSSKSFSATIDTAMIRKLYSDGDFDQAIQSLEKSLKEKHSFSHFDSVFTFKHLGVMYAANSKTREKGKYYLRQLLIVEPTARILDMYASDMIYAVFKNIQDEFEESTGGLSRSPPHLSGNAQTKQPDNKPFEKPVAKEEKSSDHTLLWVGVATVAIGVGVAAYFLLSNSPAQSDTIHPVL